MKTKAICPGFDTLVAETGLSPSTLVRASKSLQNKGLITVHRRLGTSNSYTIDIDPSESSSDSVLTQHIAQNEPSVFSL